MITKSTAILVTFFLLAACRGDEAAQLRVEVTYLGNWKFNSHIVSDCLISGDNSEDRCLGSASECGVLAMEEKTWSWTQTLSDGTVYAESGTYYLSTNYIILTGPSSPGTRKYSISGSAIYYSSSTLTFINTGVTDGCTYTETYLRYAMPRAPSN